LRFTVYRQGFFKTKWLFFRQPDALIQSYIYCSSIQSLLTPTIVVPKLASLRKSAKRDRLGTLHCMKEGGGGDREVRVMVGLDTGFMALDSIYAYICILYT